MKVAADSDKVKCDILTAAVEVFKKYGFTRVSMQDLSKESGKGRSTLYYYFKNKEEVLNTVAIEIFTDILNKAQENISPEATFSENMELYHRARLRMVKNILKEYHLVLEDVKANPALILNKLEVLYNRETRIVQQILEWAIAKKDIAFLSDEETLFLAETFVTAFQSFEQGWSLFGKFTDFEERLNWLTQILAKGLK